MTKTGKQKTKKKKKKHKKQGLHVRTFTWEFSKSGEIKEYWSTDNE